MENNTLFSILITTKNRIEELQLTLRHLKSILANPEVECIIYDDGATDGTYAYLKKNYPQIQLLRNETSKGLIYCRNVLLEKANGRYAISLDDDAHIITEDALQLAKTHFEQYPACGVQALRIFWGKELPENKTTNEKVEVVKSFVGCGHIWRMRAWRDIPNYPAWFVFYGEEEFASYHLFKKAWEIHYQPNILVQHRVVVRDRKLQKDYTQRLRRSLRAGWYLYFIFYPSKYIARKFGYTLWMQLKLKVFKGDLKALAAIFLAMFDVLFNSIKLKKERNALSLKEFSDYKSLPDAKIYWKPKLESKK